MSPPIAVDIWSLERLLNIPSDPPCKVQGVGGFSHSPEGRVLRSQATEVPAQAILGNCDLSMAACQASGSCCCYITEWGSRPRRLCVAQPLWSQYTDAWPAYKPVDCLQYLLMFLHIYLDPSDSPCRLTQRPRSTRQRPSPKSSALPILVMVFCQVSTLSHVCLANGTYGKTSCPKPCRDLGLTRHPPLMGYRSSRNGETRIGRYTYSVVRFIVYR
jgi:hypothetical protein